MSNTMFFIKTPGAMAAESAPDEVPAVLIGDLTVPDWVRLPPSLGGTQVRVTGHHKAPCPCGAGEVQHLVLNEPTGIRVAECLHGRGFMWYRERVG